MAKEKEEKRTREIEPRRQSGPQLSRSVTPFSFVQRMMADMDRLFGGWPFESDLTLGSAFGGGGFPQVEVLQKNGSLIVRADLPGLDQDDIRVNLDEDALTIEGERRSENEEQGEGWYHSERSYGSFQRRIPLPRGVDTSSCDAVFENGVLEVQLKLSEEKKQAVQIRSGKEKQPEKQPEKQQAEKQQPQNGPAPTARH